MSKNIGGDPPSSLHRFSALSSLTNNAGARESKIQNKIFSVASAVSQGKSLVHGLNSTLQSAQSALGLGSSSPASASSQPTQSGHLLSATLSVPPLRAGASVHSWGNSTASSFLSATARAPSRRAAANSGSAQTSSVPSDSTQTGTLNSPYLPRTSRTLPWVNNATYGYGSDTVKSGRATEVGDRKGYPLSSSISSQTRYAAPTLKVSKFILIRSKNAQC